jgi:hypothetical protein
VGVNRGVSSFSPVLPKYLESLRCGELGSNVKQKNARRPRHSEENHDHDGLIRGPVGASLKTWRVTAVNYWPAVDGWRREYDPHASPGCATRPMSPTLSTVHSTYWNSAATLWLALSHPSPHGRLRFRHHRVIISSNHPRADLGKH